MQSGTGLQSKPHSVTGRLKHLKVEEPDSARGSELQELSEAQAAITLKIEAKHTEVRMALCLQCKYPPWLIAFIMKQIH